MKDTIVYEIGNKLYINLTNKCSNNCNFCIRNTSDGIEDYYLWLKKEPTVEEIKNELENQNFTNYEEVVFCGFGEPLYRLDDMLEVAEFIKANNIKTRVNTNGQASLICGKDIAKKFAGKMDAVNISLNECNRDKYQKVCNCKFGKIGFDSLIEFASELSKVVPYVNFSIVDTIPAEDIEECKKLAKSVGVDLRIRNYSE